MSNEVIGAEIQFKIDKALASLHEIGDAGSAAGKDVARELTKALKSAEKEAKAAAKAVRTAGEAGKEFGDRAGRAGQNASKLAGALGMVSPAGAEAARTLADLADVGEVAADAQQALGLSSVRLVAVLGPVAIAVAAAGAAYLYLSHEAEKANERVEASAAAATAAQEAHERLSALRRTVLDKEMLATGAATAKDLELRDALADVTEQYAPAITAKRAALAAALAEERANAAVIASGKGVGAAVQSASDAQRRAASTAAGLKAEIDGLEGAQGRMIQSTVRGTLMEAPAIASKKDHKAVVDDLTDALAALNAEMDAQSALASSNATAFDASLASLMAQEDAARKSMATGEERLALDLQSAQTNAAAERDKALAVSSSVASRESVEQQYRATSAALDEAYYADLDALRTADAEKAARTTETKVAAEASAMEQLYTQSMQLAAQAGSAVSDSFGRAYDTMRANVTALMEWQEASDGHLTESQKKALDERVERQKKAARAAFEAHKIAAIATAVINTALSVTGALAQVPYPANIAAAIAAGAAGAIEIGTIAGTQPAFHKGGPLDLAPDEMSITARRREFMLNPTGREVIGDDNLRAANAGKSIGGGSGGNVYAVSVYKHTRQVDTWKKDGLLAGDPIAKAIESGKLTGHRSGR